MQEEHVKKCDPGNHGYLDNVDFEDTWFGESECDICIKPYSGSNSFKSVQNKVLQLNVSR